jgi:hypothetical protein
MIFLSQAFHLEERRWLLCEYNLSEKPFRRLERRVLNARVLLSDAVHRLLLYMHTRRRERERDGEKMTCLNLQVTHKQCVWLACWMDLCQRVTRVEKFVFPLGRVCN